VIYPEGGRVEKDEIVCSLEGVVLVYWGADCSCGLEGKLQTSEVMSVCTATRQDHTYSYVGY